MTKPKKTFNSYSKSITTPLLAPKKHVKKFLSARRDALKFSYFNFLQKQLVRRCIKEFSTLFGFTIIGCAFFYIFSALIYSLPHGVIIKKRLTLMNRFIDTFFYQNWSFFAPHPGIFTEKILIKCTFDNKKIITLDPAHTLLVDSEYKFFSPKRKETYLHRSLASDLIRFISNIKKNQDKKKAPNNLALEETLEKLLCKNDWRFRHYKNYAHKHCESLPDAKNSKLKAWQLILVQKMPTPYSKKKEYKFNDIYNLEAHYCPECYNVE